jgi:long-chain-fatty-acid--[acyl-carrier-protein] ligase
MIFFAYIYYLFASFALWLRYRIRSFGVKEIYESEEFNKDRGILFLANHPAEIDPVILLKLFWFPFRVRPVTIEYLFYIPIVRYFLNFVGGLPVPNFDTSSNSYKRKRIERVYEKIFELLKNRQNVLVYPAGGLKQGAEEVVGAASGVHHILQKMPDINIVLVRTTGLWGSSFSRAQTGRSPDLVSAFLHGFRVILKNGIFFAPRRKVLVECELAPRNFPRKGSKLEINRYLETWFNGRGKEPLQLVSYSFWKRDLPKIYTPKLREELSLNNVPLEIQEKVQEELAAIVLRPKEELRPELDLARDLGLDSLDIAQINLMLREQFGISSINSAEMTTVGSIMVYAARLKESGEEETENGSKGIQWNEQKDRPSVGFPKADTLLEAFLQTARRMGDSIACADSHMGQVSYKRLKRGVIVLALKIRELPGDKVGIMLPASVGVNVLILATLLAGKVPVMINWTLGPRNLDFVVEQTRLTTTLSSWNFLDRLENVDLGSIDDTLLLLEDIKYSIGIFSLIKALFYLKLSDKKLMRRLGSSRIRATDPAVILFTSGTESVPKGVPLTHGNILSNLRGAYKYVAISDKDVLLGMLPPFHSFGFSITGLLPLLSGMRTVFSPNPTDGRRIALVIAQWGVTLCCSAPTFLKTILRVSKEEQLKSLRLVVVGAEKAAQELFDKMHSLNPKAKMIEGYGITECSPILTLNPPNAPTQGVGIPLPEVELLIVDPETHEPIQRGKVGLILARGPNIFSGYLDKKLRSPFFNVSGKEWYETGDLGYLDERGYLTLSGRLKRFVKIGGEMVSLGAVEEVLLDAAAKHQWPIDPDVPSLALCVTEEAGEKSRLHLFQTFSISKNDVNEVLKNSGMSNLIKISSVNQVTYLPLLGSGKINYRALTQKLENIQQEEE